MLRRSVHVRDVRLLVGAEELMKLSREELGFWASYMQHLANRMGLSEWELSVNKDTSLDLDEVTAQCKISTSRHAACIGLSRHFIKDASDYERRVTMVHELLHCHLYQIEQHLSLAFPEYPQKNHVVLLQAEISRSVEFAIDDMAVAWAKQFPTPNQFRERIERDRANYQWGTSDSPVADFGDPPYPPVGSTVEQRAEEVRHGRLSREDTLRPIQRNGVDYPSGRG